MEEKSCEQQKEEILDFKKIGEPVDILLRELKRNGLKKNLDEEKQCKEKREVTTGTSSDNRNFLNIVLGDKPYKTSLDPEATLSLIGSKIGTRFTDRLKADTMVIKNVNERVSKTLGKLKIKLEIDEIAETITFKVMPNLEQDMLLGMDFCRAVNCDTRLFQGLFRVREGEWRK